MTRQISKHKQIFQNNVKKRVEKQTCREQAGAVAIMPHNPHGRSVARAETQQASGLVRDVNQILQNTITNKSTMVPQDYIHDFLTPTPDATAKRQTCREQAGAVAVMPDDPRGRSVARAETQQASGPIGGVKHPLLDGIIPCRAHETRLPREEVQRRQGRIVCIA
jgi:hypothetical protein